MLRLIAKLAATFFFVASFASAQDTRTATLVGAVTDSTGSVVPGAAVTVTNVETAVVSKGVTSSEGTYYVAFLAAGAYDLTVEAAGFKKHVQSGLVLRAGETPRVDLQLEIGAVSESVRVSATNPLLETETATVGEIVGAKSLIQMTIQQLKPQRILYYMAGVMPVGGYHILGQNESNWASPSTASAERPASGRSSATPTA